MKAKSFLEFYSQFGTSAPNNKQVFFYAQPFHPDMIAGLFENYEFHSGEIYGIKRDKWIDVHPSREIYSPMGKANIPFGTLDQFIGDCERFGIELVWHKEIIDKYFV